MSCCLGAQIPGYGHSRNCSALYGGPRMERHAQERPAEAKVHHVKGCKYCGTLFTNLLQQYADSGACDRCAKDAPKECFHCGRREGTHGRPDIYHREDCPTRSK